MGRSEVIKRRYEAKVLVVTGSMCTFDGSDLILRLEMLVGCPCSVVIAMLWYVVVTKTLTEAWSLRFRQRDKNPC